MAMPGRGHFLLSTGLAQKWGAGATLNRISLQKGEKINVAVKTCKKDCTLDNKEKFLSEAGRCALESDTALCMRKDPWDHTDLQDGRGAWKLGWGGYEQCRDLHWEEGSPSWDSTVCFSYWTLAPLWPLPLAPDFSDHEES